MGSFELTKLMNSSFNFFKEGNLDMAYAELDEAIMESSEVVFYAWWLTETNPEYSITSPEFLEFVSGYFKILRLEIA